MTNEELLKEFLSDSRVVEEGYLKEGEVDKIKFNNKTENDLIEIIKIAILDGAGDNSNHRVIKRKFNKYFQNR